MGYVCYLFSVCPIQDSSLNSTIQCCSWRNLTLLNASLPSLLQVFEKWENLIGRWHTGKTFKNLTSMRPHIPPHATFFWKHRSGWCTNATWSPRNQRMSVGPCLHSTLHEDGLIFFIILKIIVNFYSCYKTSSAKWR